MIDSFAMSGSQINLKLDPSPDNKKAAPKFK